MTDTNKEAFLPPKPLRPDQEKSLDKLREVYGALFDRILVLAPNTVERDKAVQALRDSKTFSDQAIRVGYNVLSVDVMADLYAMVEREDNRVVRVWLSPVDRASLLKHCRYDGRQIALEPETKTVNLKKGIFGVLWGAEIRVSRKIPQGQVRLIGGHEGNFDLEPDWEPDPRRLVRI